MRYPLIALPAFSIQGRSLTLPDQVSDAKDAVREALDVTNASLHVHVGLCLFLIASAIVVRLGIRRRWALAAVILAEVANELVDLASSEPWSWADSAQDVVATTFWPTVLTISWRRLSYPRKLRS